MGQSALERKGHGDMDGASVVSVGVCVCVCVCVCVVLSVSFRWGFTGWPLIMQSRLQ